LADIAKRYRVSEGKLRLMVNKVDLELQPFDLKHNQA
jgi:hypothetical protein